MAIHSISTRYPKVPELAPLYTLPEVMRYLNISRSSALRLIARRELIGHKVGSQWRFFEEDVRRCIRPGNE